jgi:hypothetical protein
MVDRNVNLTNGYMHNRVHCIRWWQVFLCKHLLIKLAVGAYFAEAIGCSIIRRLMAGSWNGLCCTISESASIDSTMKNSMKGIYIRRWILNLNSFWATYGRSCFARERTIYNV